MILSWSHAGRNIVSIFIIFFLIIIILLLKHIYCLVERFRLSHKT